MSTRVNLEELAFRESEQVEWKENVADVDDVVKALSAFANDLQNLGGGYAVCGAKEAKDEHGFPKLVRAGLSANRLKEVENLVLSRCRERVSPPITPLVEELPSDDPGKRILIFIQAATGQAHTFRQGNEGAKHFVRVSRSTIEARNGVLRNLLVRRGVMEPWDRRPCLAATVKDFDLLALRDTLTRMGMYDETLGVEPYLVPDVQISPFVPSFTVTEPLTRVIRPRNFAILLFGREPQKFVPGGFTIYSKYPELDRGTPVARRHELSGTLLAQVKELEQILDAEVITLFDKMSLTNPNILKYPRRALQEAMSNAMAHRDYELLEPVRFTSFRDRIEMVSPGSLPLGMNVDDLRRGKVGPNWRNQSLAWFLNRLKIAQAEGQGMTTIRRSMKSAGCPPPKIEANEAFVKCVLRAHPRFEEVEEKSAKPKRTRKKTVVKKGAPRG